MQDSRIRVAKRCAMVERNDLQLSLLDRHDVERSQKTKNGADLLEKIAILTLKPLSAAHTSIGALKITHHLAKAMLHFIRRLVRRRMTKHKPRIRQGLFVLLQRFERKHTTQKCFYVIWLMFQNEGGFVNNAPEVRQLLVTTSHIIVNCDCHFFLGIITRLQCLLVFF